MLQKLSFKITGVAPLIMHNGRLADPLDPIVKELKKISSRRRKTEEDHMEMARLEFLGSLYLHNGEPCVPGDVIEGALIGKNGAARKQRRGKAAMAGIFTETNFPLEYDGPRKPEELWEDESFRLRSKVNVQGSAVFRTRPIFKEWAATVEIHVDTNLLDPETVEHWMTLAGAEVGLMDWRPRFGRFISERL